MKGLATYFPKISDKRCARCGKPIGTRNITFRDGSYWHLACWNEGERQLAEAMARANEIVRRFGFATLPTPAE